MSSVFCAYIDPAIHGIIIPALFGLAVVAFLWGVFYYALAGEYDEYCREMSKGLMLWAVMALIAMGVIWAIVDVTYKWIGISTGMC